jgi:hypothetical protein
MGHRTEGESRSSAIDGERSEGAGPKPMLSVFCSLRLLMLKFNGLGEDHG